MSTHDSAFLSCCEVCRRVGLVVSILTGRQRYLCETCLKRDLRFRYLPRIHQQALLALFQQARAAAAEQAAMEQWLRRQLGETRYAALDAEVVAL